MRGWIGAMVVGAALGLATGARAQPWSVQLGADGSDVAVQCLPSEAGGGALTSLCLSVGCDGAADLELTVTLQQVELPEETRMKLAVDGRSLGEWVMTPTTDGFGRAMSLSDEEALLGALRAGSAARIALATREGRREFDVALEGSGAAIDAAATSCAASAAPAGRTSANPAQDAIDLTRRDCEAMGDVLSVGAGLVENLDVDGDGRNDLIIDYGALRCGTMPPYCGTGGCTQEVWLSQPDGDYRQVLSDLIAAISVPEPGRLRIVRDGGDCGLSGAESCVTMYETRAGILVPLSTEARSAQE